MNNRINEETILSYKIAYEENGEKGLLEALEATQWDSFTLAEIGEILGITRERVRQIEDTAMKKIRHPKYGIKLKKYKDDYNQDGNIQNFG